MKSYPGRLRVVKPTTAERAAWFHEHDTSVAQQLEKPPTRLDMALAWAAYGFFFVGIRGFGWVLQKGGNVIDAVRNWKVRQ